MLQMLSNDLTPELEVAQVLAALARTGAPRGALLQHRRHHGVHAEHRLVARLLVVAVIIVIAALHGDHR